MYFKYKIEIYKNISLIVGVAASICIFIALVIINNDNIIVDHYPIADFAYDMLMTSSAKNRILLIGHYSDKGFNHLGPFFLYMRLLGQWLLQDVLKTIFGAQLVGTMATSAAFAGLLTGLLHKLASESGCGPRAAVAAAICGLTASLVQLTQNNYFINRNAEPIANLVTGTSLGDSWMPGVVILPFLAFLVAGVSACRGSAAGICAATFSAAVLVHGNIPTIPSVCIVWIAMLAVGLHSRRRSGKGGYGVGVRVCVSVIVAVFATPIILDTWINWPGNLGKIIAFTAQPSDMSIARSNEISGSFWKIVRMEKRVLALIDWRILLLSFVGWVVIWSRHAWRAVLQNSIILAVAALVGVVILSILSPVSVPSYSVRFTLMAFYLPVLSGVAALGAWAADRRMTPFIIAGNIMVLAAVNPFRTNYAWYIFPKIISEYIAERTDHNKTVAISSNPSGELFFLNAIPGIMLALDRLGINSCIPNAEYSFAFTQERICPKTWKEADRDNYVQARVSGYSCVADKLTESPDGAVLIAPAVGRTPDECIALRKIEPEAARIQE